MSRPPLAYHITFGTYGTRLHGDARGTVSRRQNSPGEPIIGRNEDWEREETCRLRFPAVVLSERQRRAGEAAIQAICQRGGWKLHASACRSDHVHVLLTGVTEGKAIRRWLKAWLGEALSMHWPLPSEATWWAECGSVKPVWSEAYLETVFGYVREQRTLI